MQARAIRLWVLEEDGASGHWPWTREDRVLYGDDMVAKELHPVVEALRTHAKEWTGRLVRAGLDNSGGVFSVNAGRAKSKAARQLMRDLADVLRRHHIELTAHWVPRELNAVADLLSRQLPLEEAIRLAGDVDARLAAGEAYAAALESCCSSVLGQ